MPWHLCPPTNADQPGVSYSQSCLWLYQSACDQYRLVWLNSIKPQLVSFLVTSTHWNRGAQNLWMERLWLILNLVKESLGRNESGGL